MEERVIAGQCGLSVQWPAICGHGCCYSRYERQQGRGRGILTEGTASQRMWTSSSRTSSQQGWDGALSSAADGASHGDYDGFLGIHLKHQLGKVLRAIEATEAPIARAGNTINRASVHKTKAQHIRRSKCVIL